jgi:signal transduction histidine kinase
VLLLLAGGTYDTLRRLPIAPRLDGRTIGVLDIIGVVGSSVALAALVAVHFLRRQVLSLSPAPARACRAHTAEEQMREHARWLVRARWLATVLIVLFALVVPATRILPPAAVDRLLAWSGVLVAANVAFGHLARRGRRPERQVVAQIAVDLVALTGILNASGGFENPLYFAYIYEALVAGLLLRRRAALAVTTVAAGLLTVLAVGEAAGLLPHYAIALFPHEAIQDGHSLAVMHGAYDPAFVAGRVLPLVATLFLTAYLTTLVNDRMREAEREVQRVQTLATAGEMAAGLAHEVRNPLASIKGALEIAGSRVREGTPEAEFIALAAGGAARLEGVVERFLSYARPGAPALQRTPVRQIITQTSALLRVQAGRADVALDVETGDRSSEVPVDPGQIEQVMLNVVLNAIQASPRGGRVCIREARDSGFARIDIADEGPGIPPELLPRIFEPFFTTKPAGTGLGLAVSSRIVAAHGGSIEAHRRAERGTLMQIRLPICAAEAVRRPSGLPAPAVPARFEEDDRTHCYAAVR